MAYCKNCGTLVESEICPNCGTANTPVESQPVYAAPQQPAPSSQPAYVAPQHPVYTAPQPSYGGYQQPQYPQQPAEQPVSVGGWIGRSLIPCIPFVGGIIYLVMLFIWMGDKTKQETFRNWAKAQLVVMGIAIGLFVLLFILMLALGISIGNAVGSYAYY